VNWIAQIGGPGIEISYDVNENGGRNVSTDSSGNINISGYFSTTILTAFNADGTPFATTLVGEPGNTDVFVAQYSSTGSVNWVARIGGVESELPSSITTYSNGDVTVIGFFTSPTLTAYNKDGTLFGTTLALVGDSSNYSATYNSSGYVTAFNIV
jgi:DUF4097 and DUF4098 domain-containing protein YvlB